MFTVTRMRQVFSRHNIIEKKWNSMKLADEVDIQREKLQLLNSDTNQEVK